MITEAHMIILPAIDLLEGKCVRLVQGDYGSSQQVAESAIETAKKFLDCGAEWLHVVDLDGARDGGQRNFTVIEKLCNLGLKVQTGGGIRTEASIRSCLNAGVSKVILGSAAAEQPEFLNQALQLFGESIIVGVDAKNEFVRTAGWLKESGLHYLSFAEDLERRGVKEIIYTDISRDGTLQGVNLEHMKRLKEHVKIRITASGGIRDIGDIEQLTQLGLYGAICGKSLYSGRLDLRRAIERAKDVS